jgi:lysophospholipase L1-like esterase
MMNVNELQTKFIVSGILLSPILPFLYLQGQYTRLSVGRLPDAAGDKHGQVGDSKEFINFLAFGESTIAGVGAKNHAEALSGQFAKYLSQETGKSVRWNVVGHSGIRIHEAIKYLVPQIPDIQMDAILVGLGGNDVFKLSSPKKWRDGLQKLLWIFREKYPNAKIYVANIPMVRDFLALPNPTRYLLSRIAKLQHFNTIELISQLENVFYYLPQGKFTAEHFSDGIHPSVHGYKMWAAEMISYFKSQNAI